MGARRDEAHVALSLAAGLVVLADDEQPRELALRAAVRLEAHGGEAGDLAEHRLELLDDDLVALRLLQRARRGACGRSAPR